VLEYWLDADSLIVAHRGPYSFSFGTTLWDFLEAKAHEGVIGSPQTVFDELSTTEKIENKDKLELWARELKGVLFLPPEPSVQVEYSKVAAYVQNSGKYAQHNIAEFLGGADPWVIAYPMALGGRIVTFEAPAPRSKDPKIPDVAGEFGIKCLNLWDMLDELAFNIG
jgi:hypothetical protein